MSARTKLAWALTYAVGRSRVRTKPPATAATLQRRGSVWSHVWGIVRALAFGGFLLKKWHRWQRAPCLDVQGIR